VLYKCLALNLTKTIDSALSSVTLKSVNSKTNFLISVNLVTHVK
jgi:hypothetical protein